MTGSIALFAQGVALGLGAAVPIGPVNVQIARHVLRGGFAAGFAVGCGAVTVDVLYAVLASIGVQRVATIAAINWPLRILGILLLAHLGLQCFRSEREAWRLDPITGGAMPRSTALRRPRLYATGVLMTLLNPMTLAFWFIAVPSLAGSVAQGERRNLPIVCIGVFAGTVSWVVFYAGALAWAGRFRRNWWLAAADAVGGAALLVFAAVALLSSLRPLL